MDENPHDVLGGPGPAACGAEDLAVDRRVAFGDGRVLIIRPIVPDDAPGLQALYDSLDDDDRRRRFFCAYHPAAKFCAEQTTVGDRGGARLVAVEHRTDPMGERLIGEAGFSLLPAGDGEISVTIAREWRGWLGPYLLDALADAAAALGVRNLEADVLTLNKQMLALLRQRGAVVVDHDGFNVIRLRIGTGASRPTWTESAGHPRVLVEVPGARWHAEDSARAAGVRVITCHGPRHGRHGCPVLVGEPCPLAAEADAIIVSHPPADAEWQELLTAHPRLHPGVPVCIEPVGGCQGVAFIDQLVGRGRRDA